VTDESIFAAALAIGSPPQRAAFLDRACAGDPDLRREVEGLLAAHAASNPLDRPPADLGRTGAYEPADGGPPAAAPGDRAGPYRLMEQIGEGGFGLVFVAEQAEPIRRKVALKVLKPGMDTRDVVARFEAERQALALMDHPNIAKVFDAGSTPAGRPYFVMELVRGVPITDYCDQNKLPPRQRLELFVQVCQAVQHAHQKGIIHRDLKPSNVLVAPHDGVPVVKVIDFGVAKALGQSLTEKTIYTRFAQMIGTPLYMSPEQAEINQLDVDTRADVYALGVLLYELLTGTTPFDRDRFRKAAFDEIRRILREEEPPKPSTRLSTLGATLSAVSANRKTGPEQLTGLVRGELDWIVMRCLEKDRNRRYDSATGLAKDVQRYLAGDTVEACPPTLGYRLRKAYRRNRATVNMAAAIFAAALLAVAAQTWNLLAARAARRDAEAARDVAAEQRLEAERQRADAVRQKDRADEEKAVAKAISDFLQSDLLAQADAWAPVDNQPAGAPVLRKRDPDLKVRTVLDRAAAKVGDTFKDRPAVEAAVRRTIGKAYGGLGEFEQAVAHLGQAADLYRRLRDPADPDLLTTLNDLGLSYRSAGRPAAALGPFGEAHASAEKALGPGHLLTRILVHHLALAYREAGRPAAAVPVLEKYRDHTASDLVTTGLRIDLAEVYLDCGRPADAATVLQPLRRELGPLAPARGVVTNLLIRALEASGQHERAAEMRANLKESKP
jgi:serine/threonine protein kinase